MLETGADVHKIVWRATTIRDNLEAFELLQRRTKPTIALCMGEPGLMSRVLAKKFGAFLTFASLHADAETAPGQLAVDELKRLYRWDSIGPETKVYGVIGKPVGHSLSPAVHNAAFSAAHLDAVYLPMLVEPTYESFKAFMEECLAFAPLQLAGVSVTIPHKEHALRYLTDRGGSVEMLARRIGAVNTIDIRHDSDGVKLRGINTDYAAILDAVTHAMGITRQELAGRRAAVIGAGGTGRTAAAALAGCGADVVIFNRTLDRAERLAEELDGRTGRVLAAALGQLANADCELYINTTSIGMTPHMEDAPWGLRPPKLGPGKLVFDAIYNPTETRMLREAKAAGAVTVGGVEMFVRQAAAQFETWTGQPADVELMRAAMIRRL